MNGVSISGVVAQEVEILGRADQSRGKTAEGVREGRSLRDRGDRNEREPDARPDREDGNDDPRVANEIGVVRDLGLGPRASTAMSHRQHTGVHAAAGGLGVAHPVKGKDEESGGKER
jgi:hypothetical protein